MKFHFRTDSNATSCGCVGYTESKLVLLIFRLHENSRSAISRSSWKLMLQRASFTAAWVWSVQFCGHSIAIVLGVLGFSHGDFGPLLQLENKVYGLPRGSQWCFGNMTVSVSKVLPVTMFPKVLQVPKVLLIQCSVQSYGMAFFTEICHFRLNIYW